MRTCRKNGTKLYITPYRKLYKNKIYNYLVTDSYKYPEIKYNYEVYELGTTQIVEIFNKEEFYRYFIDIQDERKQKLEKINESRYESR